MNSGIYGFVKPAPIAPHWDNVVLRRSDVYHIVPRMRSAANTNLTANTLYKFPLIQETPARLTEAALYLQSTPGTGSARIGIRNVNPTSGEPTSLLFELGVFPITGATTKKTLDLTPLGLTLYPGFYFMEIICDITPFLRGCSLLPYLGNGHFATNAAISHMTRSLTYPTSLPSDETGIAQTAVFSGTNAPVWGMR